jgi:hypothetical protein
MLPGVYRDVCRVVTKDSNATACSAQREEGRAADMVGRDCDKTRMLARARKAVRSSQQRARADSSKMAGRGRSVGMWHAGTQGCASLVEWRRAGVHANDVGRLKKAAHYCGLRLRMLRGRRNSTIRLRCDITASQQQRYKGCAVDDERVTGIA